MKVRYSKKGKEYKVYSCLENPGKMRVFGLSGKYLKIGLDFFNLIY